MCSSQTILQSNTIKYFQTKIFLMKKSSIPCNQFYNLFLLVGNVNQWREKKSTQYNKSNWSLKQSSLVLVILYICHSARKPFQGSNSCGVGTFAESLCQSFCLCSYSYCLWKVTTQFSGSWSLWYRFNLRQLPYLRMKCIPSQTKGITCIFDTFR